MVTQRELPVGRYGSRAPRRTPRWVYWSLLSVFVVAGLVVAWVAHGNLGDGPITTEASSYVVVDDGAVKFSFSVTRDDPSKAVDCVVRASSADNDDAGAREVLIPAGGAVRTVNTVVHTSKRAVTAKVYGCSYQVPPYLSGS
jgi:Domain of unknown function (DUF4307)